MKIEKVEEFCACRSMKDGERCRFFRGMPPLKPGFAPNPADPAFLPRGPNEELYPDREAPGVQGAHWVYLVSGEGLPPHEVAVFAFANGAPMCWLVQSGRMLMGVNAIKREFGDLVDTAGMDVPAAAIESIREACRALVRTYPLVRVVFAVDTGNGLMAEGNDPILMKNLQAIEQIQRKAAQN